MEMLLWLEETWLATFVRESNSLLAYPTVLFLHTFGLATVAGLSALLSLRILGFARTVPFAAFRPFITVIWVGFAVTAASGIALLIASVAARLESEIFLIKLVLVALAVVTVHLMGKRVYRNPLADTSPLPPGAYRLAVLSLVLWVGATTAGRLMAYIV